MAHRPGHRWTPEKATGPAMLALGAIIILAGIVALPAPGPGMLVIAAGAVVLARESKWIAERLDAAELRVRRLAGK